MLFSEKILPFRRIHPGSTHRSFLFQFFLLQNATNCDEYFLGETSRDLRFFDRVTSHGLLSTASVEMNLEPTIRDTIADARKSTWEHETTSLSPFYFACLPCEIDSGLMAVEWDWIDLMGAVKMISPSFFHHGKACLFLDRIQSGIYIAIAYDI